MMKPCALAIFAAATTCFSDAASLPNRMFSLMDVANSTGSWLTSPIWLLSHSALSAAMSWPSSSISPESGL